MDSGAREVLSRIRVARLRAADRDNQPYVIPVVFIFNGTYFFIPLDSKRKTVSAGNLRRVKNIEKNAKVSLLVDEYSETWNESWFIMIIGVAEILQRSNSTVTRGS